MKGLPLVAARCAAFCALGGCALPALAGPVSGQGSWEITLHPRDFDGNAATIEGYYDSILGITWLADANYAMTSGYDADGLMDWNTANAWAAGLSVNGISGWRLPDIDPIDGVAYDMTEKNDGSTDIGYNISAAGTLHAGSSASEMAHMNYNTLGNVGFLDTSGAVQSGSGLTNSGPFDNLQSYFYWAAQENPYFTPNGLGFGYANGRQRNISKTSESFAWAVHAGDVGTPVFVDSDGDGLANHIEDGNGNGIVDAGETDPLDPDSDDDGLTDGAEDLDLDGTVDAGETDPLDFDSDDDGLTDGYEVNIAMTDPVSPTLLIPGDMNGDGDVDVGDLLLLQRALLGL